MIILKMTTQQKPRLLQGKIKQLMVSGRLELTMVFPGLKGLPRTKFFAIRTVL